jgi:VWFA-related protein
VAWVAQVMNNRRMVTFRRFTAVAVLAVGLWPAAPSGQQAQPPQTQKPPVFGARIDTVSVDVVVTDKKGQPVTDLTPADFEITENRKPQTIDSFKLIQIDDSVDVDPARNREIRSLADQERELMRDDVRVIVIYLDDYHTRLGNSMAIRERLSKFVRGLNPRDLVALMTPLMSTAAVTFSRNHDATARQIMNFQGRKYDYTPKHPAEEIYQRLTPEQIESLRNQIVTTGLEGLCVYLGSVRDGRKSVLYVSEGLLSSIPPGTRTTGLFGGTTPPSTLQEQMTANAAGIGNQSGQMNLLDQMKEIFLAASRSNTSFYPMDPRGLAASEFSIADGVGMSDDRAALNASMDVLHILATNTDGRAIVNSNDPQPALQQMLRDSSAYYLLGYTSTEAPRDGKFHPIRVNVKRKDVEVRSRSGYWAYSDEDVIRASKPSFVRPPEVEKAFDAIADPPGGLIRSWWTSDRGTDGRTAVTLVWEALRPTAPDAPTVVSVTASVPAGDLVYRGRAEREADPTGRVAGRVTFPSPPGALMLRLVAENANGDRLDASERDVVVPDYTGTDAKVTTPHIFRVRTARDIQQLKTSANPLPTTARQFTRTERLFVRFRVYLPGGAAATPQLRLLNRNGDVMSVVPVTVDPSRGAEGEFALGGVPPGDYLLEAAASSNADAPRVLVAFRVTG